jgi:hypothetical protein
VSYKPVTEQKEKDLRARYPLWFSVKESFFPDPPIDPKEPELINRIQAAQTKVESLLEKLQQLKTNRLG